MDVFRYVATLPSSNLKRYSYLLPALLPPMSDICTAADVSNLLDMATSSAYSFSAEDAATMSPAAFLSDDDVRATRNSKMPLYIDLAENSCVSKIVPQGPLHPRMYFTMLYRADALTTMATAGVIRPDRAIPSDWDGLLEVLEAHQRLVSLLLMQANTSSARPSLALPRYGLCVNADHTCGRLGDLFAAIAASIVQFNGTRQGYIFDLTLPPPTLKTLFSRPGWRRAAEVLQSLLQYNAPAAANAAAAVETIGPDGQDGPSCHGIGAQVFNTGECLITFEFETSMRMASIMPAIREKLGVAPVPGSRDVAAGPGGALVPCTADLCAVSYNHDLLYLQPTLEGAEAAAAASLAVTPGQISGSDSTPGVGKSPLPVFAVREAVAVARLRQSPGAAKLDLPIVNRAPFGVVNELAVNVRYTSPTNDPITLQDVISIQQSMATITDDVRYTRQIAMDALRATVGFGPNGTRGCESYAQGDWWRVLAPSRGNRSARPRPNSASPPNAAGNLSSDLAAVRMPYAAWSGDAALFDATQWSPDTAGQSAGYFRTVWHALHSPNVAPHPRSPMQINLYRHAFVYAAMALLPSSYNDAPNANATGGTAIGGGVERALAELERAWALVAEVVDPSVMRDVYEAGMSALYLAPAAAPAGHTLDAGEKAAIGAAVGAAGVVLLVATVMGLVMLRRRRRRQHRDLFGRVMAPKEGPDTTLLITDVQNSTVLWEQLPVEVMDIVLKLHHLTIRSVLARHSGYESATEGDSFIVAFATPSAALAFATSCQVALLHQNWPPQLLDHPDGAPVLVLSPHDPTDPNDGHGTSALPALGFIASSGASSRTLFPGSNPGHGRGSMELKRQDHVSSNGRDGEASRDLDKRPPLLGARQASARRPRSSAAGFVSGAEAEEDGNFAASTWGDTLAAAFPVLPADSPEGRRVHALLRASTMDTAAMAEEAAEDEEAGGVATATDDSVTQSVGRAPVLRLPDGRVAVVAYRGLRVRMGLHSGLKDPAQVAFNKVVSSYAYKGDFAELAKLVSDAAPGGLITLSHYAFARLRHTQPGTGSSAADALNDQSSYPNDKQHPHRSGLLSLMSRRGLHQEDGQASEGAVIIYAGAYCLTEPKARGPAVPALRSSLALTLSSAVRPASVPQAPMTPSVTTMGPVAESLEFSPFTADAADDARDSGHKAPGTLLSTAQDGPPLEEVEEPHALFLAVPPSLLCRLALRPQLRVVRTVKLGSLAAPVRRVTVAFMKVVGASLILSDLPGPGARALEAFQQIAGRLLTPGGGYKVEGADGLVLAVFASPVAALAWACSCITALCQHQWEDALLAHELCQEELGVSNAVNEFSTGCNAGALSPGGTRVPSLRRQGCGPLLQAAGPRIKVGLDVGTVTHTLTEASGRLSYRGKPMNRAARIAGIGGAGQVLCSGDTWEACGAEDPKLLDRYVSLSLGCMALKGVAQPLEVVQVLPEGQGCG
ncbi:hypothetical protein HYH03_005590 [Edaphochlamys debaryana]|uniref:Guanylate cyclase domain-containing protein n=1 Tax=Edaphochlamys debaryana TaxID=47281 RepID=A0A836C147_9CHLO|nr:hypothetical protein HYH03_005590 [Edaphochlamys debaryana]|eukprot:KAG2496360.1 hypothetical protein HYH03_005590 [Edaphochlamys debaryana]